MNKSELKVVTVATKDLKAAKYNPRKWSEEQLGDLIIEPFGGPVKKLNLYSLTKNLPKRRGRFL